MSRCPWIHRSETPPGETPNSCYGWMFIPLKLIMKYGSGWWFGTFFIFPNSWDDDPIWLSYFSEGWLNHQPNRFWPTRIPFQLCPWWIHKHFCQPPGWFLPCDAGAVRDAQRCGRNWNFEDQMVPIVRNHHFWLVLWNMAFMTFHILGMSSSQPTKSYFSEGLKPPTRFQSISNFPSFMVRTTCKILCRYSTNCDCKWWFPERVNPKLFVSWVMFNRKPMVKRGTWISRNSQMFRRSDIRVPPNLMVNPQVFPKTVGVHHGHHVQSPFSHKPKYLLFLGLVSFWDVHPSQGDLHWLVTWDELKAIKTSALGKLHRRRQCTFGHGHLVKLPPFY